MRTTLDLNDKLMQRVKLKAMQENKSLKEVINQALSHSLDQPATKPSQRSRYKCPTYNMGQPKVNLDKALQVADELEDEAIVAKLEMRK